MLMKEKGLRGDFKPWAGKARRMGGDLSRDGEGCGLDITCLACLPVHVCAYDTCKWRRQRGSWVCRPQTQGQLRLEERVLYRERELKHSGHRTCLPGALQSPESFSDFVGRWVYIYLFIWSCFILFLATHYFGGKEPGCLCVCFSNHDYTPLPAKCRLCCAAVVLGSHYGRRGLCIKLYYW